MESNIPLPTDNIYKFYSLFGLLLLIFSLGSTLYVAHTTNDIVFQSAAEMEAIHQIQMPSAAEWAKVKRYELAIANRDFEIRALGTLGGVAILLMAYGFWKWHKVVQPVEDEMARLQLEKLRYEVGQLRKPASHDKPSQPKA